MSVSNTKFEQAAFFLPEIPAQTRKARTTMNVVFFIITDETRKEKTPWRGVFDYERF